MWVRLNQNPGAPISNENCNFQGDPLWLLHGLPEQPQLVDWRRLLPLLPANLRSIRTARRSVKIQILSNTWYFCTGIFQLSKNLKWTKEKKNKICFDFNRNYDISFLNRPQTWAIRKWKRGFPQRAKYLSALVRAITLTTACQTLSVPKQNFIKSWDVCTLTDLSSSPGLVSTLPRLASVNKEWFFSTAKVRQVHVGGVGAAGICQFSSVLRFTHM